ISSGAWSPPIASTAMVGTLCDRLPREAGAERAGVHAVLEGGPAVHREHGHVRAPAGGQRTVAVDVRLLHGERDGARRGGDHGPHFVAEMTVATGVQGEPDHRVVGRLVDTPGPLKYRSPLRAASPSRPSLSWRTQSSAPGGSNTAWRPATSFTSSASLARWV